MNDYKRRTEEIFARADKEKKRRKKMTIGIIAVSLGMCVVLTFGLVLFLPYSGLPDVSGYAGSEYYDLIKTLNPLTYRTPYYKNNFEKWFGTTGLDSDFFQNGEAEPDGGQNYAETTNNQVAGVIEGDLFKRSDKYIYYLTVSARRDLPSGVYGADYTLKVYSIAGAESAEVLSFTISADENIYLQYSVRPEIYLSEDCQTVSVVAPAYDYGDRLAYTAIVPLDVSDAASVKQREIVYVSGGYISSRSSDGELILITDYGVGYNTDFGDNKTFVPQSGTAAARDVLSPDEIIIPDGATAARYTIVSIFDGEKFTSRLAFLSYAAEVYVDRQDIYLSQQFSREADNREWVSMTRISRVAYGSGALTYKGAAEVAGTVKDQYSLDARGGVLRIVTTTTVGQAAEKNTSFLNNTSASLFCMNIDTLEIIAKAENFAPLGETVRSVRFDGDKAYVCTSIALRDLVFIIDLGDLTDITIKDSGEIGGYSTSLIKFAGNTLLGIGYDEMMNLKVELYIETPTAVESLTSYVCDCNFSKNFKSYMIDAENGLIGLCVEYMHFTDRGELRYEYLLLSFDGANLRADFYAIDATSCESVRSTMIDGAFYILSSGGLRVVAM